MLRALLFNRRERVVKLFGTDGSTCVRTSQQASELRTAEGSSCASSAGGGHTGEEPSPVRWRSGVVQQREEGVHAIDPHGGLIGHATQL
eukprot:7376921-Prymnesium_polylepis.3